MRTIMSGLWITAVANLAVAGMASAQERPTLVELFTSEGCSSCPPAESFLGELAKRPDVLALAFHVDYWDGLGWPDRFVIPEATPRQRDYARALGLSTVYTPQMVIDGRRNVLGSDRVRVLETLAGEARHGVPVQLTVEGGSVVIVVDAAARIPRSEVTLMPFTRSAVSAIGRGENAGRSLTEYNIVRGVMPLGQYDGDRQTFRTEIATLPKDATDVAVIIQARGQPGVLGVGRCSIR